MSSGPFLCKCINEKSSLISSVWETVFCKYVKLLLRKHRFSYWSFMYINNYGGMFNCLRMPQGTQAASINFMGWSFHMEETSGQPCCRWPACTPAAACISGDRQMNRKPDRWTSLLRIAPTWWGLNHCFFVKYALKLKSAISLFFGQNGIMTCTITADLFNYWSCYLSTAWKPGR